MKRRDFLSTAGAAAAVATLTPRIASANGEQRTSTDTPTAQTIHEKVLAERQGSLKGLPEPIQLPKITAKGLEEYVPSTEMPWDKQRAGYLIRRAMFGAKREDVDMALTKSPGEVVDMLLADDPAPAMPKAWINETYWTDTDNSTRNGMMNDVRYFWLDLMVNQNFSIREKMAFFWHDHWATESVTVRTPHYNYWFIDMLRKNSLGDFKQLVKDVTLHPCMLVYLDGWYNTNRRPNENYARELYELHTLGEGNGYTEEDILETSRALTGWTLKELSTKQVGNRTYREYHQNESIFIANRFDDTDKTIFGQTANFDSITVIDNLFAQREQQIAKFICRKLYREFVYEIVDEDIIDQLAQMLIANNWEIKPVMSTLLKSAHFMDSINFGAHITSPLEHLIGAIRMLEMDYEQSDAATTFGALALIGCQLLDPPGVKGWPAYRTWISASRLASRWFYTDALSYNTNRFDTIEFAKHYDGYTDDPLDMMDEIIADLVELKINDAQRDLAIGAFIGEEENEIYWVTLPESTKNLRLRELFKHILRLGEYQII